MTVSPFSPKQKEFVLNANRKYNIAHGGVRSGKTVICVYRFMQEIVTNPGQSFYIFGYSLGTIYRNIVHLLLESTELGTFRNFCSWSPHNSTLFVGTKKVICIGCGDAGALGVVQGLTIDSCYCDEMTLYPENVIHMIHTRLSREHSTLFASMNPKQPSHPLKKWIDYSEQGDPLYYSLHFVPEDNPFLAKSYIEDMKKSLSGLFYKRNYLGLWCMAEGAIFDFFDKNLHVIKPHQVPCAEYYIAGIDFASSSTFACVIIGCSTGRSTQSGKRMWVEKEYYWDAKAMNRMKTNAEFLRDLQCFVGDTPIKSLYIDPSASSFKVELRKAGIHCVDAENDVIEGIRTMSSLMASGVLMVCSTCTNLIREIEGYIWDEKKAGEGEDKPVKKADHAVDAVRYCVFTHKVASYTSKMPEQGEKGRWMMQ